MSPSSSETDSGETSPGGTAPGEPVVRVRALSHAFRRGGREERVLHGVDLIIRAGESVALLGRSGSGKSTLLNIVGGLVPVQSGEVRLFGDSLAALDDRARTLLRRSRIGFVHQAFNLVPTLSVGDNITLPLALDGRGAETPLLARRPDDSARCARASRDAARRPNWSGVRVTKHDHG